VYTLGIRFNLTFERENKMSTNYFTADELGNVWAMLTMYYTEVKQYENRFDIIARVNAEAYNNRYGENKTAVTVSEIKQSARNYKRHYQGLDSAISTMAGMIYNCAESKNCNSPEFLGAVAQILGHLARKSSEKVQWSENKVTGLKTQIENLKADNLQLRQLAKGDNNHLFRKGDILESTWGYNQTNANFYQVVRTTKAMVVLQEIGKKTEDTGNMTGTAMPDPEKKIGKEIRRKVQGYEGREFVMIEGSYQSASKWDGKPVHTSSYH
jgi:hypothetical protein